MANKNMVRNFSSRGAVTKKYAVIGLGRFGAGLARALARAGGEVIAVDRESRPVEKLRDEVTIAARLDSTDEDALRAQGVAEVDVAVVSIGDNFEATALTVAILKSMEIPYVVARAESEIQERILRAVGAHDVSAPEHESALRWAHRLELSAVGHYIELGDAHSLVSLPAPRSFVGRTLVELDVRNQFGVNLIAIERGTTDERGDAPSPSVRTMVIPRGSTKIQAGDALLVVGENEAITAFPRD